MPKLSWLLPGSTSAGQAVAHAAKEVERKTVREKTTDTILSKTTKTLLSRTLLSELSSLHIERSVAGSGQLSKATGTPPSASKCSESRILWQRRPVEARGADIHYFGKSSHPAPILSTRSGPQGLSQSELDSLCVTEEAPNRILITL
mmetsp:Transcript_46351/g.110361  ORF Transcript_46351/g.110361 Transcript_46351/m.110361 type:complete len:147 (+) Transcript_46351:162-602(+)